MKEDIIKSIILEWHNTPLPTHRKRCLSVPLDTGKILSIIGPRRAGKTAFCHNLIQTLLKQGRDHTQILYINFEDERLDRETEILDMVLQQYQQLYPTLNLSDAVFVFDEIQNIPKWELFVRRVYDTVCKQIIHCHGVQFNSPGQRHRHQPSGPNIDLRNFAIILHRIPDVSRYRHFSQNSQGHCTGATPLWSVPTPWRIS